jgi:hypothetical protein
MTGHPLTRTLCAVIRFRATNTPPGTGLLLPTLGVAHRTNLHRESGPANPRAKSLCFKRTSLTPDLKAVLRMMIRRVIVIMSTSVSQSQTKLCTISLHLLFVDVLGRGPQSPETSRRTTSSMISISSIEAPKRAPDLLTKSSSEKMDGSVVALMTNTGRRVSKRWER